MTPHLAWRALNITDLPALVGLLAASEKVDQTGENYDADDLRDELTDAPLDLATDTVAVLDDQELVGMGVVRLRGLAGPDAAIELLGTVHPARRGEGIGRGILAHQLHRAAELHAERNPGQHGRVLVRPYDHNPDHVRLVRAAGLTPQRHWFDMERDLTVPLPPVPVLPAALVLHRYDRARDDEVRTMYNAAFDTSYGSPAQDVEGWDTWFTGSRAFRPDLSTMAIRGGQVVGLLLSYFYEADAATAGYSEGWIGQVGVLPPWRRQGLGAAMIARALHEYKAAGFSRAVLDVDGEGEIGGLGVYSRLGFGVVRKRTSYVRRLPPAR